MGILLCEDIDWPMMERTIRSKYNFTENEIANIKNSTVFHNRPKMVRGRNILFTDGGVVNLESVSLLFDNVIMFPCGNKEVKDNTKSNVYVLQDDRVYEPVHTNGINYKKKILFDRLRLPSAEGDKVLVYGTKNCRQIDDYKELEQYGDLLIITNEENRPAGYNSAVPPVPNLFDLFHTYVYTPIQRKWDCSPRFIAECVYFNKKVVYHNIDYWDVDHGLRWRQWDIDNDFSSLFLEPGDEIISILRGII